MMHYIFMTFSSRRTKPSFLFAYFLVLDAALLKVRIVANLGKLMIQHARGLEEVPLRRSAQNEMTLIIFGELAYLI